MQAAQDKTKGGPGGEKLWSRRIASWFLAWRWLEGNRATGPPGATGGHEVPKGHPRPRITCRVGCLMVGFVSGAEWGEPFRGRTPGAAVPAPSRSSCQPRLQITSEPR